MHALSEMLLPYSHDLVEGFTIVAVCGQLIAYRDIGNQRGELAQARKLGIFAMPSAA